MPKLWKINPPHPDLEKEISQTFKISPLIARVLIQRNLSLPEQIQNFLYGNFSALPDPFLLKGMRKAVARIKEAVEKKEKIMLWGDYDVDGLTSLVLIDAVLKKMGTQAVHYIPHRIDEGYGLNLEGVKRAKNLNISLLISVDCGVASFIEIDQLNQLGIQTIIFDHHEPLKKVLPRAWAIVDPKQNDCPYPDKNLCAVGLAFKLAQALIPQDKAFLEEQLDLVALGTAADVVPLVGENRILLKLGIESLNQTKRKGLVALKEFCGLSKTRLSAYHLGFILAPRLNASGRIGSSEDSLRLLLTEDSAEAELLAETLEETNRARQKLQEKVFQEAVIKLEREINFKEQRVIVLDADTWHPGVIGIVASRLVDKYYRPTIMISTRETIAKGSGRSIKNFHLLEAIENCAQFLEGFGGHCFACGLNIRKEKLPLFKTALNEFAKEKISPADLQESIEVDAEVELSELNEKLLEEINLLTPFGNANPEPVFCARNLILKSEPAVIKNGHLKLWVSNGERTYPALGFNLADYHGFCLLAKSLDVAFHLGIDEWQGERQLQLEIEDLRES